jgi:peptide/nickel transport system permease protein
MLFTLIPLLVGILVPFLPDYDPVASSLPDRLLPPMWEDSGKAEYPLGSDGLGRNTLYRLAAGARVSMIISFLSVALAGLIGVTLGIIAGYTGGWIDAFIMKVTDIQLSIPYVALAMAMVAVFEPGIQNIVVTLAIVGWILYARVVRAEVLSLKEREFIEASRAVGASHLRIIIRHALPNVAHQIIVIATFAVATMITLEAALSFLGLGVQPPQATWGSMLSDARQYIRTSPWQAVTPGVMISLTLIGINLIGDGLRDIWDPRLRGVD